jgi:predicted Fe-Mo cluster-binding NifX family protein
MNIEKIAVTADIDNGLDSPVSGHFGHCGAFIVATVKDGEIAQVESVINGGHSSCSEPVSRLVDLGVSVLITMGMGMRPFIAAQQMGLSVVRGDGGTVREAVQRYIDGRSRMMDSDGLCAGGGDHRH